MCFNICIHIYVYRITKTKTPLRTDDVYEYDMTVLKKKNLNL